MSSISNRPEIAFIPDDQTVGEPAELSLEEAQQLREMREFKIG